MLDWLFTDETGIAEPEQAGMQAAPVDDFDATADLIAGALAQPIFSMLGLVAASRHGDVLGVNDATFRVPVSGQWSPAAIMEILKHHHVDLYGWSMTQDFMLFVVCRDDTRRVQSLFNAYGVPTV